VGYAPAQVPETQSGVRVELASEGTASVATGLPVLDHLVGELARTGRLRISLEVAPGSADQEVAAAADGAVHPGLAIPVSAVDSRTQRFVELIKAAEKDGLPRIPGEESKDEAATRADDLDGNQHERLQKGFEFHG